MIMLARAGPIADARMRMLEIDVWTVFLAALITAVATGLGALPFFFVGSVRDRWLGLANGAAAGLMLAASHSLIGEGLQVGAARTLLGVLIGVVAIVGANALLRSADGLGVADLRGADARKAVLILGVMTAHSLAEGIGIGVSFAGSDRLGLAISAAISIHNIPEGLAISLVLVPRGTSVIKAAGWSVFSSLPQPLMAVPAFLFVRTFEPLMPVGLGIAAGAMLWMIFAELVPDALQQGGARQIGAVATLAFALLLGFQHFVLHI